jgi:multiple sugar transport system substrate-binding protein
MGAATVGGAAVLAACAPAAPQEAPTAQVIEKQVTSVVKETVVVQTEKTVVVQGTPAAPDMVVLTTAHAWEAAFEAHQEEFDNKWTEKNSKVFIKRVNSGWSDHNKIVPTWAAAGELPDIIYVHGSRAFPWNQQGIMITIDDFVANDASFDIKGVFSEALRLYKFKGKQFEIPYDHGPMIMGYNVDLFDKYKVDHPKPDWTWDDFRAIAEKMTVKKDKVFGYGGYYGSAFQLGNEIAIALAGGAGGKVFEDDESKIVLDSPESIAGLKFWAQFIKDGLSPNPAVSSAYPAGIWITGNAAMFGLATWGVPQMHDSGAFKYDVLPWPKGPKAQITGSFGSGYGITKDSKHPDIAWKYMHDYLNLEGMAYMWGDSGRGSPARTLAYDHYIKSPIVPPSAKYFKEAMDTYAVTGHPYQTLVSAEVGDIMSKYAGLVSTGEMTVEDCVSNIVKEANPKLADALAQLK